MPRGRFRRTTPATSSAENVAWDMSDGAAAARSRDIAARLTVVLTELEETPEYSSPRRISQCPTGLVCLRSARRDIGLPYPDVSGDLEYFALPLMVISGTDAGAAQGLIDAHPELSQRLANVLREWSLELSGHPDVVARFEWATADYRRTWSAMTGISETRLEKWHRRACELDRSRAPEWAPLLRIGDPARYARARILSRWGGAEVFRRRTRVVPDTHRPLIRALGRAADVIDPGRHLDTWVIRGLRDWPVPGHDISVLELLAADREYWLPRVPSLMDLYPRSQAPRPRYPERPVPDGLQVEPIVVHEPRASLGDQMFGDGA